MTLNDINPGGSCRILDIEVDGPELQRLMDVGFIEGVVVQVIRNAPLKDPIDIRVKGRDIALRRSEAKRIAVETV